MIVCSARPGALGPAVGAWLTGVIAPRAAELGAALVPIDLGDLDLPLLDEEEHPSAGVHQHEDTRRWSTLVDGADGFIVVAPEHNYGMPAALKNALDHLGREWAWKPIGFVSYGNTSAGTRSVQHANQVLTPLRLVPLGATVAIRIGETIERGRVRPSPSLDAAVVGVLDELVRVAHALRPMRERQRAGALPGPLAGSYLRRLIPDDAPEVTVLQRCCWVDEAIANDTMDIPALHESPTEVREWLTQWQTLGLWLDGRLMGMVRTLRVDTDWHLGRLAVVPDLRGRGVGRWLLHTAEAAVEPGCQRMVLSTGARNERNLSLYRSEGYHPEPSAPDDIATRLTKPVASAKK